MWEALRPARALPPAWKFQGCLSGFFASHLALEFVLVEGQPAAPINASFFHPADRLNELALPTLTRKLLRHAGIDPRSKAQPANNAAPFPVTPST